MAQPSLTGPWRAVENKEVSLARRALTHPGCWPLDCAEREQLSAQVGQRYPESKPGVALVVTATDSRGTLFALERAEHRRGYLELGAVAAAAMETARQVIARDAAALMRPALLGRGPRWRARMLAREGMGRDEFIEGSSLGVSAALALLSELAHRPVPSDLVASATVDREGHVGPVEGLSWKLEVVSIWGLGVRRFMVAREQADELRQLVNERGVPIEVCGVRDVADVVCVAFPDLFEQVRHRLRQHPEEAERVSGALYSMALGGTPLLQDWGSFAKTAALVGQVAPGDKARRRATIAAAIAGRHCGRTRKLPIDGDWLSRERRPRRLALYAHGLQTATDAAEEDARLEAAARAALAPDLERTEGDLRLLGALGRYHAAWHRFDEASRDLRDAIDAWLELDAVPEASFPLCELLRVTGLVGDARRFEKLGESILAHVEGDPRLGSIDRAFLALALVRALVQFGRCEEALEQHARFEADWLAAPSHVEASGERWRALALEALGREPEALHARERVAQIARRSPHDAEFCVALTELDAALHRRSSLDAEGAVEKLRQQPEERREVERIAKLAAGRPLPWAVARYWRY